MESGPSVRWVFAGVGISFRRSGPALVVVACDIVVVVVVELTVALVAVLEVGELLHPATAKLIAAAAAAKQEAFRSIILLEIFAS